ncbi:hydrogenase maturation nickel metallochaperone HypA/HybF [Ferrimonas aestuarii]|uniref:Hydrogenase maturation factor HypA n=1 Tax=Ferrimonas aestuarii TaxID=2569539 RepID=A0A4U1BVK4_9GAMM|nr:hydrogenase maturation nickel metallochaperone HypA [Ferrimonas aestuarii]TKB58641.1 hydrogenase maturation nickel metallochaperone HypA [Ferrimonas aestuarii]
MHELGVVMAITEQVQDLMKEHQLEQVDTIVLQIGELSSMIPHYVEACYPAAIDGTPLEQTELKIEIIPANALCHGCQQVFNIIQHGNHCPECQSEQWGLLSGKEFILKEIVAA